MNEVQTGEDKTKTSKLYGLSEAGNRPTIRPSLLITVRLSRWHASTMIAQSRQSSASGPPVNQCRWTDLRMVKR